MCCPSAPAGYLLQAERLHYKGCVLFLACTRLFNDCYLRIGKKEILTPPDLYKHFFKLEIARSAVYTETANTPFKVKEEKFDNFSVPIL